MILYIDPSVMTYAIQAIVGVVIAVGAAAGIIWRKTRKKINNKLGIDENKNKEVESDDIEVNDDDDDDDDDEEEKKPAKKTATKKKTSKKK